MRSPSSRWSPPQYVLPSRRNGCMVSLLSVVMDGGDLWLLLGSWHFPDSLFSFKKPLPCLTFPAGVCDCEGASRFPWASSPFAGRYTRATGLLGRLSGWPSAIFLSALLSPRSHGGGACQGWGAAPPEAQRRALALTPESPLAVYCEALPRRDERSRGAAAGRASSFSVAHGRSLGRKPRAARRAAPRPGTGREGVAQVALSHHP
jgi:hypothetical protein